MVLLKFFFGKTIRDIEEKISRSFDNMREDMSGVAAWINHFRERHDATESEIANIKAELEALKGHVMAHQRISEDKTGQVRTIQRTRQDKSKDMSFAKKEAKKEKSIEIFDKSSLAGSHLEIMALLYHSDRPLSYEEISKRLNKTTKSIRNLIYEMRSKGVDISDKPLGSRQKGFYLTKEAKIKVSGR